MEKKWSAFVEALNLEEELKQQVCEVSELKIEAHKNENRLLVYGKWQEVLENSLLLTLEQELSRAFAPFEACIYPSIQVENRDTLGKYLEYHLKKNFQLLRNSKLRVLVKDESITCYLPSSFHEEFLQDKNLPQIILGLTKALGCPFTGEVQVVNEENREENLNLAKEKQEKILKVVRDNNVHQEKVALKVKKAGAGHVLYGTSILEEGTPPLESLVPGSNLVFYGRVASLETRDIGNKSRLYTFVLLGKKTGVRCKMFVKKGEEQPELKNGQLLKVKGKGDHDPYERGVVLSVKAINYHFPVPLVDEELEKRVELHLHTKMSSLDSNLDLKELFLRMKEYGHDAVAITDHGVVQAFPEAYDLGRKMGIKVVFGMEAYLYDDFKEKNYKGKANHAIILVKNMMGLKNLYHLVTESHLNHFYRRPRVPRSKLLEYREGLLVGSACEAGEIYKGVREGLSNEELLFMSEIYDYLEIQPNSNNSYLVREGLVESEEKLNEINKKIIKLGQETGKIVVATGDVHFLEKEDSLYRAILMKSKGFKDVEQPMLYYRSTKEMLAEFSYLGEELAYEVVVTNPRKILESIDDNIRPVPEELYPPEIEGAEEQVVAITTEAATKMYGSSLPEFIKARLKKELDAITTHGFSVLYLIAHKLVKKSNEDGYMVGSRGSVGSSLVATMMGITEVNPLPPHYRCPNCYEVEVFLKGEVSCGIDLPDKKCAKCTTELKKEGFNIPFETFLGFKGDKVPDIDLNFSGEYQPIIHQYTVDLFGEGNVFKAGTIGTVAEKTAFGFVKKYFEESGLPAPNNHSIQAMASGCIGVKRTTGQHPGGLMVVPKSVDVHQFTPLQRPADDLKSNIVTTHFDYHSISERLVKLDLLGHDDPTIIKYLERMTNVDAKEIPLDDPSVMSLFVNDEALKLKEKFMTVGSLGLPEFGTGFVRQMLIDTKPKVFSDLIRISGFSHGTDVWVNNAKDLIISKKVTLSEAISTRDDIMVYLMNQGLTDNMSFIIMESVRKGKGLTAEMEQAMRDQDIPNWYIDSCKKISYMFPKAHATAYVTMAFRLGYFKLYYKKEFYAAYFSVRGGNFDLVDFLEGLPGIKKRLEAFKGRNDLTAKEKEVRNLLEIACEMYLRDVEFTNIDILESDSQKFKIVDGKLLPPFSALGGLGEKAAAAIVRERAKAPFLSIEDLKERGRISQTVIDHMRSLGILDSLPLSQQISLF